VVARKATVKGKKEKSPAKGKRKESRKGRETDAPPEKKKFAAHHLVLSRVEIHRVIFKCCQRERLNLSK
jgi:hypothetical protein